MLPEDCPLGGTETLLAKANDEITEEVLNQISAHQIDTFEILYTNDLDRGPIFQILCVLIPQPLKMKHI